MTTAKSKRGFSIIEMMVAMAAFAVMALTVGSMLFYGWLGWRDNFESVAMQRDAMVAMRIMGKEIRNSKISEITSDNGGIYFSAGVVRTNAVDFLASDIAYSPGVVLNSFVCPEIDLTKGSVLIQFSLSNSRGTDNNDYEMTIYARN